MAVHLQHHGDRLSRGVTALLAKLCPGPLPDKQDFKRSLIALSRLVDCAVASAQLPSSTAEILQLLRLIWLHRNDSSVRPAIMVLLISVKSACQANWFKAAETEELLTNFTLFSEQFTGNRCVMGPSQHIIMLDKDTTLQLVDKINSRFLPWFKASSIILSIETKPGYVVVLNDFNVLQPQSRQERLRLYVCHKEIESSSCLISPPQMNIVLNGKGVDKRTTVSMDTGPQVPTDVTHLLRVGGNLLQAVGELVEPCIIAIAIVSAVDHQASLRLQHYVVQSLPPDAAADGNSPSGMDDDVIEGPSRVSLHCPISHKRISTPVKGVLCKHLQCFDYLNYIGINERRPAWRCPYCGTPACFPDLRLDRLMAQVIKNASGHVKDVMILPDGTWEAAFSFDDLEELSCSPEPTFFAEARNLKVDTSSLIDLSSESMTEAPQDGAEVGFGIDQELQEIKPNVFSPPTSRLSFPGLGSVLSQGLSSLATVATERMCRSMSNDESVVLAPLREVGSQGVDLGNCEGFGDDSCLPCSTTARV